MCGRAADVVLAVSSDIRGDGGAELMEEVTDGASESHISLSADSESPRFDGLLRKHPLTS